MKTTIKEKLTKISKFITVCVRLICTGKKYKYYTCLIFDYTNYYVTGDPFPTKASATRRMREIENESVALEGIEVVQIRTNTKLDV